MDHQIRLSSMWQRVLGENEPETRLALPAVLTGVPPGVTARYLRVFHRPTGLENGAEVFLVIPKWRGSLRVFVNDVVVATTLEPQQAPGRFPITDLLQPTNKCVLELTADNQGDVGVDAIVVLEITL